MVITVSEALKIARQETDSLDAEILLCTVLGIKRDELLFKFRDTVTPEQLLQYKALVEKRKNGCPVSYITGEREFYSLDFYVTPSVLIPRPDTETLAEWAIEVSEGKRVLDICTGSGCIGITVAKNAKKADITLLDVSSDALLVARKNAERHGVLARLVKCDILKEEICGEYDVVVSNPPYIARDEIKTLETDVKDFEPLLALDGGDDGLLFYPVIAQKAYKALAAGGYLGFEVGAEQADDVARIMEKYFSDINIICDLAGKRRVVTGHKL